MYVNRMPNYYVTPSRTNAGTARREAMQQKIAELRATREQLRQYQAAYDAELQRIRSRQVQRLEASGGYPYLSYMFNKSAYDPRSDEELMEDRGGGYKTLRDEALARVRALEQELGPVLDLV